MSKQSFTTGQVLTAAQVNSLQANDFNQTVSVKTANYTLAAADKGTRIEFNTSGSVTCTVNSGLFDAGDTLVIQNRGAGTATITAGTATVNTSASLALAQYSAGTLYFVSDSAAIFFGDAAGISASIVDAKGDLIVGTADNTVGRLAVGTNGYTLVADSVETTGLKWAAPASGLTLIKQASFSAVADTGTTFDAMFSSSYFDYLIVIDHIFSSVNDTEIYLQGRIATPSTIATGYYGITTRRNFATGENNFTSDNAAQFSLGKVTNAKGGALSGFYHTSMVGNSSEAMKIHGFATDGASIGWDIFGGKIQNDQTYTGFLLKASSGNVTGRVSVYGMAK